MNIGVEIAGRLLYFLPLFRLLMPSSFSSLFAEYDLLIRWLEPAFGFFWIVVFEWLIRCSKKVSQKTFWKDLANVVVALFVTLLVSLPVGWTLTRLAELFGEWVMITWSLIAVVLVFFFLHQYLRTRKTAADRHEHKASHCPAECACRFGAVRLAPAAGDSL